MGIAFYNASRPVLVSLPKPENGAILFTSSRTRNSELEIVTQGEQDYFIKLRDSETYVEVISFYVHGGMRATINVPSGSYFLNYACGTTWYGTEECFGIYTSYAQADDIFTFSSRTGWTVEMYPHVGGNLDKHTISASKF